MRYDYSYHHRHVGSCLKGMGCSCCWDAPEDHSSLYSSLEDVVDLYKHEDYFKEEIAIFEKIQEDYPPKRSGLRRMKL